MTQRLGQIALLVREYDEAIRYYTEVLGFELLEDTQMSETKRWVRVNPPGSACHLLLAKAATETQEKQIGCQAGGRVFYFCTRMISGGITKCTLLEEWNLFESLRKKITEQSRFSRICMAIFGI